MTLDVRPSAVPPGVKRARRLLRVAVVTETYPPEVNGVARSVARIVEGLLARRHKVQLVRPRQDGDTAAAFGCDEVLTRGVSIPMYGDLRVGLPSPHLLEALWTRKRPDLVHIATEGPLGWSALRTASKLGLPVCSEFRTNFHSYSAFYGLGWLRRPIMAYLRRFHNRGDVTMVPTEALRQQLAQDGFRALRVVSRGVDTQLFSPQRRSAALRAQWGLEDDDPVVLYVGRLAPEKNLAGLADAFQALLCVQPRARLLLVGDGPSRKEIEARCPQAIFAGFRSGNDLAAHYASSDVFLFPSLTETFGNVTLEAMASGLAVVAYRDAGAAALIRHGDNGLLAARGDAASLTRLAIDAAANMQHRRRLGAAARDCALELGWNEVLRRMEDVYGDALAGVGRHGLRRPRLETSGA